METQGDAPRELEGEELEAMLAHAVEQLEVLERIAAQQEAVKQRVLASILEVSLALHGADAPDAPAKRVEYAMRSAGAEVAAATRTSARSAPGRLVEARALVESFPEVLEALADGRLTPRQASVIREQGMRLETEVQRADFVNAMVRAARTQAHTRLETIAKKYVASLLHEKYEDRCRLAREERRVVVVEGDDGMSELIVVLPTFQAMAIFDRLTQQAKAIRTAAQADDVPVGEVDARTFDQLRTDVFADLLLTSEPGAAPHADASGISATVIVTVPALSVLGRSGEAATLNGAPIPLDDARALAASAPSWVRVLTHPANGAPLAVDTYSPSAEQRRLVWAGDERCRIPGCRRAARRCDLDHLHPWSQGGATDVTNLAAVCRGHHTMRHHTGWRAEMFDGRRLKWIAPRGREYLDEPDDVHPVFRAGDEQQRYGPPPIQPIPRTAVHPDAPPPF